MKGRPVDRALTEGCPIGKDGYDACYVFEARLAHQ